MRQGGPTGLRVRHSNSLNTECYFVGKQAVLDEDCKSIGVFPNELYYCFGCRQYLHVREDGTFPKHYFPSVRGTNRFRRVVSS